MVVAFLGTHVPLLTLLFYFISSSAIAPDDRLRILGIALLATLMGTAATLLALHNLLSPIGLTAFSLRNYWDKQQLPTLPTQYTDDAGILMANATQIVKQLDDVLRYVTDYDRLTGLPNRELFKSRLQKEISTIQPQQRITVFIVDVDGFKDLNTVEDDEVGNRILRAIAQRLTDYADGSGTLARLGNDEFALFQKGALASEPGFSTAQNILRAINQPYPEISPSLYITASIGISIYPTDSDTADRLIADAYTALQQANHKSDNYQFYSPEIAIALQKHLRLAKDLRSALANNQLLLHYQPRIDWRSSQMVGVECLIRWQHPELGWVSPAEFIPIAEETGLILPIGEWILRTACQQNKAWQRSGLKPFAMAVNLSARQIESPGLVDFVQLVLRETELAPKFLELEVTESLLMGNTEPTLAVLESLHSKGIALALDDFGTGYSSLSYLRKFPFDTLKIDQSFVKDMVHSADAAEVIRAIVSLAKGLRLGLIAEGIETEEQLNQIKTYDCHEVQGYYFSKPLPAEELTRRLQQPHPWQVTTPTPIPQLMTT
ncbi:GGDEF domain-containing phosphodiesterase [Leptolyngbya sp. BC1307]|uniref:putative bifunctional diguanylate cyclase/phosphodiesterase n=1 Tax=Leptolyngbya sp. BC1307 TaxID=2029589 RepID=UPI001140F94C|nr:GGDEF domain-containing phosphodiesterase [Leptolyngbya sp. BC1307]